MRLGGIENDVKREHQARQLSARSRAADRPRRLARIGGEKELRALGPGGRERLARLREHDREAGLRKRQRRKLGLDRGAEPERGAARRSVRIRAAAV